VPVGPEVRAPARGMVVRVVSEFQRGGLKVAIDHGGGLLTTCGHLARAFVREGQPVRQGESIGLSGYSGIDGLFTFPWGIPHVHFNTWLGGRPVDPFPYANETSLFVGGWPKPLPKDLPSDEGGGLVQPSKYDPDALRLHIEACTHAPTRKRLESLEPLWLRGGHLVFELCYRPTRFPRRAELPPLYSGRVERFQAFYLPFSAQDVDRVVFWDELR
ncbi:MAG: M23 family metallopeptidase, partial [Sandaracinaceae bacterium]|nr:M23 family metallopeptidase [Sandaracinaceae bacterium]